MHELSLAQGIIDIVREHAPGSGVVRSVKVRVGEVSGVVIDSLEFCFGAITKETPLEHARLDIERLPFVVSCRSCSRESRTEPGFPLCPNCGSAETSIVSGTELQVVEIEVDDTG